MFDNRGGLHQTRFGALVKGKMRWSPGLDRGRLANLRSRVLQTLEAWCVAYQGTHSIIPVPHTTETWALSDNRKWLYQPRNAPSIHL